MRAVTFVLLWFGVLACQASDAQASVFMRLGRGAQALEQLGGAPLHIADVRINGQPGKLAVYGFNSSPEALAPDLRKALSMPELTGSGGSLVTHVDNGRATSLLLLPGSGPRSSVTFLIEQSEEAQRKSQSAPPDWPGGIVCPDATLLFSAENEKTRTSLAVASTAASPEAAVARIDATLSGGGWVRMPPFRPEPGMTVYAKGNRVCLVGATASGDGNGGSRLTILQRLGTGK
jgi:hypothetical protein